MKMSHSPVIEIIKKIEFLNFQEQLIFINNINLFDCFILYDEQYNYLLNLGLLGIIVTKCEYYILTDSNNKLFDLVRAYKDFNTLVHKVHKEYQEIICKKLSKL
jgi:hypothetical protein